MAPFLVAGLFLAGPVACNGMGGSTDLGGGTPDGFAIVSRAPNGGAAGVPVTATVVVNFSSAIDAASVTTGALTLNDASFGTLTVAGAKLTFTPSSQLNPGSIYVIALSPDIRGLNGVSLGVVSPWGFKTAGTPPPPPDTGAASPPRPR